ncbi:MAG: molybdate ABC transporter permease subunit [Phycisphaeraceae bacterium]
MTELGAIMSAVGLSLLCAAAAVVLALPAAMALAWVLARRNFRGKALVEALVMLPLVVPPVVTGYLLLVLLARRGLLGPALAAMGVEIVFTWVGAALAQAVIALPMLVLALRVAFESIDPELEQAAATEGATPLRIFWSLVLPMSWHGLAAGCVLAYARALGEFGATILVAGNIAGDWSQGRLGTRTLPLAIFSAMQWPGGEREAAALVIIGIAMSLAALMVVRRLFGGDYRAAEGRIKK